MDPLLRSVNSNACLNLQYEINLVIIHFKGNNPDRPGLNFNGSVYTAAVYMEQNDRIANHLLRNVVEASITFLILVILFFILVIYFLFKANFSST